MKRFIKNVLVFFALMICFLLVKKTLTPFYLGDPVFKAKIQQFNIENGQFNSIVFGSSRLYRHVNSLYLDSLLNDYNFSTYNFSNGGTYNPESYYLYDNFINSVDSGQIKYAFVEIQNLNHYSEGNITTTKASYWNNLKYLNYAFKYIYNSDYESSVKQKMYESYFASFIYGLADFAFIKNFLKSNNVKEIGENGFYSLDNAKLENGKNNGFIKRYEEFHADTTGLIERAEIANVGSNNLKLHNLNEYHLKYLNSLISQSNKKGIHLIYIIAPRLNEDQYGEILPIANALPKGNIIKLYNSSEFKELYFAENSFDLVHLNLKGANIFTKYLAEEFRKIID